MAQIDPGSLDVTSALLHKATTEDSAVLPDPFDLPTPPEIFHRVTARSRARRRAGDRPRLVRFVSGPNTGARYLGFTEDEGTTHLPGPEWTATVECRMQFRDDHYPAVNKLHLTAPHVNGKAMFLDCTATNISETDMYGGRVESEDGHSADLGLQFHLR